MEEQIQKSWWKRNWKWVVPTGGCLTIIIALIVFMGFGMFVFADKIKNSSNVFAFMNVITEVQKSVEVKQALGTPIHFEGLEDDSYDPSTSDRLDLDFKIQGTQSDGQLRVIAYKTANRWDYSTFTITVEKTGEVIDLKDQANE